MSKDYREEKDEKKLLLAKINDKYKFSITKNQITNTDFLNMSDKIIAQKFLNENKIKNYLFFGGNDENSDRNILIFYPEKFNNDMVEKNLPKIVSVIRIKLPKDIKYEHKNYLSGILKLGIKREKVGDILVRDDGADIIVLNEIVNFMKNNLENLTRFKSSQIEIIDIKNTKKQEIKYQELKVIVSSMRLDNFISELGKCSRSKAIDIINEQRVQVNYNIEQKYSKKINIGDLIIIRGKGKFIIGEIERQTKSEKYIVNIKKYI